MVRENARYVRAAARYVRAMARYVRAMARPYSFIPILQTLEKICNKCGRSLPLSEFSSNISNPDGLDYTCRRCRRRLDFARRGGRRKDPLRYVTDSELLAEAARRGLITTTPPTTTNP